MARCILLSEVIFLDPSGWFVRHYSSLSDTQTAEIPYNTLQQEAVKLVAILVMHQSERFSDITEAVILVRH